MKKSNRPVIIVGNWKMYKTEQEAIAFIQKLIPKIQENSTKIYLAVPFTLIKPAAEAAKNSALVIGAQNMHDASQGAFTGEIAGSMLRDAGAKFVILGHSERRFYFNETNDFINRKVKKALEVGLQPLLCIGESKEERKELKTEAVLKTQLEACLDGVAKEQAGNLMIAYEPIWAVGTAEPALPTMAQETEAFIRKSLGELFGKKNAETVPLLYGGSLTPENAHEYLEQPDIDGLLVGGASLSVEKFSQIATIE